MIGDADRFGLDVSHQSGHTCCSWASFKSAKKVASDARRGLCLQSRAWYFEFSLVEIHLSDLSDGNDIEILLTDPQGGAILNPAPRPHDITCRRSIYRFDLVIARAAQCLT